MVATKWLTQTLASPLHGADDWLVCPLRLAGQGAHRFYVGHRRTAVPQAMLGILSILSGRCTHLPAAPVALVLDLVWIGTCDFHDGQTPNCAVVR